jgi:hypothetical protein
MAPDEQRFGLAFSIGPYRVSDPRPTADYYRRVATELEELAAQTQSPDVRRELLDLADRFRRMAARRERDGP